MASTGADSGVGRGSGTERAGRAAGALTMAAAYGYVHPADPAEQWQADHLVRSVDEMASWLRQRLSAD